MSKLNIAGIIVVIIMLILLYIILKNNIFDNFIVFVDDVIIPKSCWEYLVTNGTDFFLFNSKMLVDGVNNPLKFKEKHLALEYLKKNNCPINIPYVDLMMRKKNDDPTVSLQRYCNHKVAPNLFDIDVCGAYGSDTDILNDTHIAKLNNIQNDKKIYANYDIETCMIDKVINDEPDLDDTNFNTNFKTYFDRLNSNINI